MTIWQVQTKNLYLCQSKRFALQISFVLCRRIFLEIDLQFVGAQLNKKAKQTFKAVWRWCTRQESNLQPMASEAITLSD